MGEFDFKPKEARNVLDTEDAIAGKLDTIRSDIEGVRNNIGFKMAAATNAKNKLDRIASVVGSEKTAVTQLRSGLKQVIRQYEHSEKLICDTGKDGRVSGTERIRGIVHQVVDNQYNRINTHDLDELRRFLISAGAVLGASVTVQMPYYKKRKWLLWRDGWPTEDPDKALGIKIDTAAMQKPEDSGKKLPKIDVLKQKEKGSLGYWENGKWNKINSDDPNYEAKKKELDKGKTKKLASVNFAQKSVEVGLANVSGKLNGKYGSLEGDVKVGYAEAHGNAYVAGYTYDSDGHKQLTIGIGGEVGTSVTALSASGKALLGNDYAGVFVKGKAEVLKGEVKAGTDLSLMKNGKVDPNLYVGGSAEFVLAGAEGTIGRRVLGTDIGVTGGVKVGVGAHANVGYHDGKFVVDVGAAIGVGVDVKLDIDVSGTVKMVGDIADKAVGTAKGAVNVAKETGAFIGKTVSGAWNRLFG